METEKQKDLVEMNKLKARTAILWILTFVSTAFLANLDFDKIGASKNNLNKNSSYSVAAPMNQDYNRDFAKDITSSNTATQQNRKNKAQISHPVFDPPFQIPTNYFIQGGVGLRWSQHYFDNPFDMQFIDGLDHLTESKNRRVSNMEEQLGLLYKPGENEPYPELRMNDTTPIYLSHTYYKTKWNTIDSETYALASAQNGYMPNKDDGTCQAPEATENDIDLSKERIMSNRVKMGLAEMGTKEEQKNLRQSALMSYAFGWQPSCELPIDKIERNENEQIIESIFSKMAKVHHIDNYQKMVEIFSSQEMSGNRLSFSRSFYTVDHGQNHPVTKLGGVLEGIQAKDISTLSKSKSPRAATFFGQKVEIQPNFINFNMIKILVAEQIKFTIENIDTDENIVINNMMTSSPEILVYPPKGKNFPLTIKSGQKMTFSCLISPETWGLIQGAVIVSFDAEFMFMIPLTAFSASNDYNLDPVYYTNVNVGETVQGMLKLKNPSNSEELEILEIYSNDDQLKLYWPNQVQVASQSEVQSNRDFSKYLKIEAGAKTKTILHYKFETDQILDHRSLIHILTNRGEIIRIPFYFHVYPDLVKFTPSVVDFGIVPFRFDLLRIPVTVGFRNGYESGVLYLTEVLLPIHDKRLDFVMGSWDRENFGNIQVMNKNSRRLEEHRRGVIQKDKQLSLFTIIMNPIAYGPIDTEIVLVFQTEDGVEHRVDLPIIGHVLPQSNLMTEFGNKQMNSFQPWTVAKPAITIDVSNYLNEASTNPQQALLKNKRTEERLILANTLGKQMKGFELISTFSQDQTFVYMSGSSSKQGDTSRSASIAPGQTLQLGVFVLNLKDFKTTAGRFYFFVQVNGNLFFPMAIQVTENRLVCSYQPDDYTIPHYKDCQSGLDLKLGNMVPYQAKCRPVNMTNIGSEPVQIDWLIRSSPELSVRIKSVHPQPGNNFPQRTLGELNLEDLKTRVGIWIYPQQTIIFEFCSEANQRSLFSASEISSTHVFKLQFLPRTFTEMTISLQMKVHDGVISFNPKKTQLSFSPAFFGQDKHESQSIYFKSSLSKKVLVKSVSVDDARFKIQVIEVQLKNQTEVVKVTFDPNAKPQAQSVAVGVKNPQDVSKVLQRVTNQDGSTQSTQQVSANFELQPLAIKDFTRYRSNQETLFKDRKKHESIPVSANLVIETDFLAPITYKLKAEIVPAQIITQQHIDFGRVHIGGSISHPLVLKNPFTDPLKVQIYIGRTTLQAENELKRLKLQAITQEYDEDQDQSKIKQKFAEKLLHKLNYTDFYCFRVLSISKDNKFLAESTPPMTRQWNIENEWQNDFDDSVYLNREAEKDTVCTGILRTLSKYESKEEFEKDQQLWYKIDEFFRELLISNINLQTNLNLDSLSYDQLNHMGVIQQIEGLIDQLVQNNESLLIEAQMQQKPVDQIIFDDTIECSRERPLLDVKQNQWSELTQQLAFPNYIDFNFSVRPWIKNCLSKMTLPFTWTSQILRNASKQETWFDYGHSIFSDVISTSYEVFQESLSPKRARPLRPEDFLVQRARDRNFFPAATITAQYQLLNEELHKDIVRNNGTIGIERSVQNFFINQKFSKMITIPPLSNVSLSDAIIFEPHVLTTIDKPLEMSLYVKTDKQFLMKVELTGQSVSSVLELTDIAKLGTDEKQEKVFKHQRAADIPVFCNQSNQNRDRSQPNCFNEQDQSELINQQVFGRSTLTPLINLKVEFADVLPSDPESVQKLPKISILQKLFNIINRKVEKEETQNLTLASRVDWLLTFANIGNEAFKVTKVGFEDQITGEITCQQGEVTIEPCGEILIAKLHSQTFHLYLNTDYSTSSYKKTLVFVSQGHIQRFPVHINTDMNILEYANQTDRSSQASYLSVVTCVALCLILVGNYLREALTSRFTKQGIVQQFVTPAINIQSSALPLYQQVQDRFRMHNAQFMREATNLGKRSNSALLDYQKSVTALKKPAAQVTVTRIRMRMQNQFTDPENKDQDFKEDEVKVQDENQAMLLLEDQKPLKGLDILQSPIQDAEIAPPPVIQEKTPVVNKEHVMRMNKKERRAYELRKKENENAADTQLDQSNFQHQKDLIETQVKPLKVDTNSLDLVQDGVIREMENQVQEVQAPSQKKTDQTKIIQSFEETKKTQTIQTDKKQLQTESDTTSQFNNKTIKSKEVQNKRQNQLITDRETRVQREKVSEYSQTPKIQPPVVSNTEEQILTTEELKKDMIQLATQEQPSEAVKKVLEEEIQTEVEIKVSEPLIETVPMSHVQSEYKKVEEYKQTVRHENYVFRPKKVDEIIQVEPPKYKRVVGQSQPKVQEEVNQPAATDFNQQRIQQNNSQTSYAQSQKNIYQLKQTQDEPENTTFSQYRQATQFEPSQSFQSIDQSNGYNKKANLGESYVKSQKQQPVKPQQVAQQVYQPLVKPQSTRTVTDIRQENYADRNQANQTYFQKQKEYQTEKYTYQYDTNYERKAPYKQNHYQERPKRDNDQVGYDNEVSDYDSQSHKFPASYAYQRNKNQQEWQTTYDQEDDYEQEYNEEYDSQVPIGQYQQYEKRPQWQQNQETSMSQIQRQQQYQNNQNQKAHVSKTTQEKLSYQQKQKSYFGYEQQQPQVYQPKVNDQAQKMSQGQTAQPAQQPVVGYWKPKETKSKFDDKSTKLQTEVEITPVEPVEEVKQEPQKIVQEEQKANNFYNAFKSIQSIFSQKKVLVEDDEKDDKDTQPTDFRRPTSSLNNPGMSLFGNSLFAKDITTHQQDNYQRPSYEFLGQSRNFKKHEQEQLHQTQNELFKPQEVQAMEPPILAFKPLREYNNVFSDSLDTLTNIRTQPKTDSAQDKSSGTPSKDGKDSQYQYKFF